MIAARNRIAGILALTAALVGGAAPALADYEFVTAFGSFGTANGQVFASSDEGASWSAAAEYLPPIYSVSAAVI